MFKFETSKKLLHMYVGAYTQDYSGSFPIYILYNYIYAFQLYSI